MKKKIKLKDDIVKEMTCEEVVIKFENLVHKATKSWCQQYIPEELFQVGCMGLVKAYNSYDIDKGSLFITLATICVRNELLMYDRDMKRNKEVYILNNPIPSEGNEVEFIDIMKDEKCDIENSVVNDISISQAMDKLSQRDKDIINLRFIEGRTQKEVGDIFNLSQPQLGRIEKRILKKLRYKLGGR